MDPTDSTSTFNAYAVSVAPSKAAPPDIGVNQIDCVYYALGLAGKAGEVASIIKKMIRDNQGVTLSFVRKPLTEELGNALFYLSALSEACGFTLDEIAQLNEERLRLKREATKASS